VNDHIYWYFLCGRLDVACNYPSQFLGHSKSFSVYFTFSEILQSTVVLQRMAGR
jgi:hypothetical protein